MKKNHNLIIVLIFQSFFAAAQFNVSIGTFSGYESNINKSPDGLLQDDILLKREQLHLNSSYQDGFIDAKYQIKWKNNLLRGYLNPKMRYYFSHPSASIITLNSRVKHLYSFSKNTKLENNIYYKIRDREGADLEEVELRTPLGYKLFNATSLVHFKTHKKNRTFVKLNYGNKRFDNSNSRAVVYDFYGVDLDYKNNYKPKKPTHYYGFGMGYYSRFYSILRLENREKSDRNWTYLDVSGFYNMPITKRLNLKTSFYYQNRKDRTQDRFGYTQIKPSMNLKYKFSKLSVSITGEYYIRDFDNLEVKISDEDRDALKYTFVKFKSATKYQIDDHLSFSVTGFYIDRASNNVNLNSQAFREYTNYYFDLGVSYKF